MIQLPTLVANYVAATNAQDGERVAACFVADGEVRDEGHVYQGRAAIAAWVDDTSARYGAVMAPRTIEPDDAGCTLRAEVSGNFPGSPAVLAFHFVLRADGIAALEVTS